MNNPGLIIILLTGIMFYMLNQNNDKTKTSRSNSSHNSTSQVKQKDNSTTSSHKTKENKLQVKDFENNEVSQNIYIKTMIYYGLHHVKEGMWENFKELSTDEPITLNRVSGYGHPRYVLVSDQAGDYFSDVNWPFFGQNPNSGKGTNRPQVEMDFTEYNFQNVEQSSVPLTEASYSEIVKYVNNHGGKKAIKSISYEIVDIDKTDKFKFYAPEKDEENKPNELTEDELNSDEKLQIKASLYYASLAYKDTGNNPMARISYSVNNGDNFYIQVEQYTYGSSDRYDQEKYKDTFIVNSNNLPKDNVAPAFQLGKVDHNDDEGKDYFGVIPGEITDERTEYPYFRKQTNTNHETYMNSHIAKVINEHGGRQAMNKAISNITFTYDSNSFEDSPERDTEHSID